MTRFRDLLTPSRRTTSPLETRARRRKVKMMSDLKPLFNLLRIIIK